MLLQIHKHIQQFTIDELYGILKKMGEIARKNPPSFSELPRDAIDISTAPPNPMIIRLIIHVAMEAESIIRDELRFYYFNNWNNLEKHIIDSSDWTLYAGSILLKLNKFIRVGYKYGLWEANCDMQFINNVKEIRELLTIISIDNTQLRGKNILYGSIIIAGGEVHIGDKNTVQFSNPKALRSDILELVNLNEIDEALEKLAAYFQYKKSPYLKMVLAIAAHWKDINYQKERLNNILQEFSQIQLVVKTNIIKMAILVT